MPKPPGWLQQQRQGRLIRQWQVVMICPSRELNVGDSIPVQEFVERRLVWIERLSERRPPSVPPLPRALGMLLMPENQRPACSEAICRQADAAALSLRQLQCRCGSLSSAPQTPASRPFTWAMSKPSARPGSMSRVRKNSMPGSGHGTMGLG